MATTLTMNGRRSIARPLKVLVPLIQNELTEANEAGVEHYRHAGEMLLEAKEQVTHGKWGSWLSKNFKLSQWTANAYMRLARQTLESQNGDAPPKSQPQSLNEFTGHTKRRKEKKKLWKPFKQLADNIDVENLRQDKQAREEELKLHRELAQELIDLGYRALAMRLHPDRGGSHEAMKRLTRVRDELKSIAETRRFV